MPKDDPETEHRIDQHERVGNDEDPILERPTVDGETERRRNLADKEPLRDTFARFLLPLFPDLFADRQDEHHGTEPTDRLRHRHLLQTRTPGLSLSMSGTYFCTRLDRPDLSWNKHQDINSIRQIDCFRARLHLRASSTVMGKGPIRYLYLSRGALQYLQDRGETD